MQSGQAVTLGVAALANQTAVQTLLTATAISSFSAEALQTQVLCAESYAAVTSAALHGTLCAVIG